VLLKGPGSLGPPLAALGLISEFFCRVPLGRPKIKIRSKNGPNVNRKRLNKLLTDVEPEINMTVYVFMGTDGDKSQLFFFKTSGAICNIITILP
jgi:hypothetical protein